MASILFREGDDRPGPACSNWKQLLPNIVDGMAAARPSATYMEMPRDRMSYRSGSIRISYRDFADTVNGIAWWIEKNLGRSSAFNTIAYMGINDIRYNSFVLACIKTGHKALLMNSMNSTQASISLLQAMGCDMAVTSEAGLPEQLAHIAETYPMKTFQVPELDELLQERAPHYAYLKTFEIAKDEPLVCVHTSGSTGAPKPRVITHAWAAAYAYMQQLEPPEGFESNDRLFQANRLHLMSPPFFAGSIMILISSIFNQTTVILHPSGQPRSAEIFLETLEYVKFDAAFLGPATVDEIGKNPDFVTQLAGRVETIVWAGGSISDEAANRLSTKVKLWNINGSTETGGYAVLRPSGDWSSELAHYICPHPLTNAIFEHVVGDTYHLKIARRQEVDESVQPVFCMFPDIDVYDTRDIFSRHPTMAGFWRWQGRADDVITLQQGAKVNPASFEGRLMGHTMIKGALLSGSSCPSLALLVEPSAPAADPKELVETIWPMVESLSKELLGDLSIKKENILVTSPDKPMSRAGKGSIQRQPTLVLYEAELAALYGSEV